LSDLRFAALVGKGAEAASGSNNQPIAVSCSHLVRGKTMSVQLAPGMTLAEFRAQILQTLEIRASSLSSPFFVAFTLIMHANRFPFHVQLPISQ
jgi:hypothetical protein